MTKPRRHCYTRANGSIEHYVYERRSPRAISPEEKVPAKVIPGKFCMNGKQSMSGLIKNLATTTPGEHNTTKN